MPVGRPDDPAGSPGGVGADQTGVRLARSEIRELLDRLQIAIGVLSLRAPFLLGSLPEIGGRIEQTLAATQASQSSASELELAASALIAWLLLNQGCPQEAEKLLERSVAACDARAAQGNWRDRPATDIGLPAVVDYTWGAELMIARRDRRAIGVFARARETFRGIADHGGEAACELFEALAAGFFGSAEQAMTISQRHLERTTAAGWRNSAIGVRRGTATKTINAQLASIFQKLMINSRDDIGRFVPRDERDRVSAERSNVLRQSRDKPRSFQRRPRG